MLNFIHCMVSFTTCSSSDILHRVCSLCLRATDPVLDEKCQCPLPPPPFYPLLSFSGCLAPELWSMISAGSLVTTDGEEKQTVEGCRSGASGCSQCTALHVLLLPCTRGGVRLSWTVNACTQTGVNIVYKRQQEGGRAKVCFKYDCTGMFLPCRPLTPQRKVLDLILRKPESPWNTNDDSFDCIWKQKWSSATEPPVMKVINDYHLPETDSSASLLQPLTLTRRSLTQPKHHFFCSEFSPGGTGTLLFSMCSHHLRNNAAVSASSFCHGFASLGLMKTSKAETGVAAMWAAAHLSQFASLAFE